jgi:hypothetical protein
MLVRAAGGEVAGHSPGVPESGLALTRSGSHRTLALRFAASLCRLMQNLIAGALTSVTRYDAIDSAGDSGMLAARAAHVRGAAINFL